MSERSEKKIDRAILELETTEAETLVLTVALQHELLEAATKLLPIATQQARNGKPNLLRMISRIAARKPVTIAAIAKAESHPPRGRR